MADEVTAASAAELLREADAIFGQRKHAEALPLYRAAAERGASEKDRAVEVQALAQVARCFSLKKELAEGRTWLARAEKAASPDEPHGWSRLLGVRGIFEREEGDKAKAKATFVEMYEYCRARKLERRAVDAIHHIAIVVPLEEQPAWALKGIEAATTTGDEAWLAVLWNNLGATYEDLKQPEKALDAYLKARELHHRTGGPVQKLAADWAVGHTYRLCGKQAEARPRLEKTLAEAEALYAKEKGDWLEWVGWCRKDLGETLIAQGEHAKGLALLKAGRTALAGAGMETHWPEGMKQVDEAIAAAEAAAPRR
jgi:tetratricopeptide (TPR) repeat protein